jgi:hypothetical protein
MAATQEPKISDATTAPESQNHKSKIDITAPAGSKNSLGEESVRDGRPTTDDGTVEAMDEATPGVPEAPSR